MAIGTVSKRQKHAGKSRSEASSGKNLFFARRFFQHPRQIGWLLPSSRFLVNEVLAQADWASARLAIEYGPGVGSFTLGMLERMRPDARLIAVEIDPDFVAYLRRTITDPRLTVVHGSAADVDTILGDLGHERADCVVSGIPFSMLAPDLREQIVRKTRSVLHQGGTFLVYQVSDAVKPHLEAFFSRVSSAFEIRNVIPVRLFYCAP